MVSLCLLPNFQSSLVYSICTWVWRHFLWVVCRNDCCADVCCADTRADAACAHFKLTMSSLLSVWSSPLRQTGDSWDHSHHSRACACLLSDKYNQHLLPAQRSFSSFSGSRSSTNSVDSGLVWILFPLIVILQRTHHTHTYPTGLLIQVRPVSWAVLRHHQILFTLIQLLKIHPIIRADSMLFSSNYI